MLRETYKDSNKRNSGFTLIELLMVIGISLVIASAAATPIYGNLQGLAQIHGTTADVIQTLRMARERAVAGVNDSGHGVYLSINESGDDSIIIYQGSSYDLREAALDREILLTATLNLTSTTNSDINFSQGLGMPSTTGVVSITHEIIGSSDLSINKFGIIGEE